MISLYIFIAVWLVLFLFVLFGTHGASKLRKEVEAAEQLEMKLKRILER